MKIIVTQDDIDAGERDRACTCPVAIAAKRALRRKVVIGRADMTTDNDGRPITLPIEARRFIDDFDAGKPVSPFEFEIDLQEKA